MWKTVGAALVSASLLACGVLRIEQSRQGLAVTEARVGTMPVTVYRRASAAPEAAGPVVLLAHGFAGSQQLASLSSSSLFLPYANFWYPNRFVFEVPVADFDQADRLEFIAKPEEVRTI